MKQRNMKGQEELIEAFGAIGGSMGLNRSVCRMYALLYVTGTSLSPSEIGRMLGISKANVSMNMRKLEEWKAVKRVRRKGCARVLYRADDHIEEIIVRRLQIGLRKRLTLLKGVLRTCSGETGRKRKSGATGYLRRLEHLGRFVERARFLVDHLDQVAILLEDTI